MFATHPYKDHAGQWAGHSTANPNHSYMLRAGLSHEDAGRIKQQCQAVGVYCHVAPDTMHSLDELNAGRIPAQSTVSPHSPWMVVVQGQDEISKLTGSRPSPHVTGAREAALPLQPTAGRTF